MVFLFSRSCCNNFNFVVKVRRRRPDQVPLEVGPSDGRHPKSRRHKLQVGVAGLLRRVQCERAKHDHGKNTKDLMLKTNAQFINKVT